MSSAPAEDPSGPIGKALSAPTGLLYTISDDSLIHEEDGEDDSFMVVEVGGVGRQTDTRESWDIPGEEIDTLQILGNGEYGEVWKGLWKRPAGKAMDVAIKSIKTSQTQDPEKLDEFIEELVDEATLMENFNHKHVVTLFGTSYKGGNPMIVMEFCPLGELKNFVMEYKLKLKETTLVLSYVCQIAEACQYLHGQSIIHRDLAARNILVKNPETVKVADFGLSRYCEDTYMIQGNKQLPLKWMPPECIRFRKHNFKSDVWMYAVCAWEVLSYGKKPFANLRDNYLKALQRGVRLKKPVGCPQPIFNTLQMCWSYEWAARPSFGEVVEQIKAVLSLWPKFNDPLPNVQWNSLNGGPRAPAGDEEFAFLRPLLGPSRGPSRGQSPQTSMVNSPNRSRGPSPVPGRTVNRQNPFANDVDLSELKPTLMMRTSNHEARSDSPGAFRQRSCSAGKSALDLFKNKSKPEVKKSKSTDNLFKQGFKVRKGKNPKNPFADSPPSSPVHLDEANTGLTASMPSMPPMTPDAGPAQDMSTPVSRFSIPSLAVDRLSKSSMQLDSFAEQLGLIGLEDPEDLEALGLIIDEPPEELGLIGLEMPTEAAAPDPAPPNFAPQPDENALSPEMAEQMGLILDLGDSAEELGLILDAAPAEATPLDPEVERKRAREAKRAARRAKKLQKAKEAERLESGGRAHRSVSAPAAMNDTMLVVEAGTVEVVAEEPDQAAAVTEVAPPVESKKKTPPPVLPKKKVAPAVLPKPSSRAPAAKPTSTFPANTAEEQPEVEEDEEEEENDYSIDLTPGTVSKDRVYKFYGTISWTIYSARPSASAAKSGVGISTRVKALVQDSVHLKELGPNPSPDLYTPIVVRLGRQFESIMTETRAHMAALADWGRIARMKRAATSMGPKLQNFFENAAEASVNFESDQHQSLWEATTKAATSLAVGSVTLSDLANPNRTGGYEFFRPDAKS